MADLASRPVPPRFVASLRDLRDASATLSAALAPKFLSRLFSPVDPRLSVEAVTLAMGESLNAAEAVVREEAERQAGTALAIAKAGQAAPEPSAIAVAAARARAEACTALLAEGLAWRTALASGDLVALTGATERLGRAAAALAAAGERDTGEQV